MSLPFQSLQVLHVCAFCFPVAGIVIVGIAGIVSCILGKVSYSSVMLPTLCFFQ